MKRRLPLMGVILAPLLAGAVVASPAGSDTVMPGVTNAGQAHLDYKLKCQGCHRPDGSGDMISNPPMNGKVAKFLHVAGGREFLGRVPGVATVDLDNDRLSNVLNWTLYRFDRETFLPVSNPIRLRKSGG